MSIIGKRTKLTVTFLPLIRRRGNTPRKYNWFPEFYDQRYKYDVWRRGESSTPRVETAVDSPGGAVVRVHHHEGTFWTDGPVLIHTVFPVVVGRVTGSFAEPFPTHDIWSLTTPYTKYKRLFSLILYNFLLSHCVFNLLSLRTSVSGMTLSSVLHFFPVPQLSLPLLISSLWFVSDDGQTTRHKI